MLARSLNPQALAALGQPSRLQLRAGRCKFENGLVTPLPEKGRITVYKDDIGLTHFEWRLRTAPQAQDDLILMEGEAKFERVPQCTTGRVFLLDFGADSARHFYWMQEPNEEKDDVLFRAVQKILSPDTPDPTPTRSRVVPPGPGALSQEHLLSMIEQQQQNRGTSTPATPANPFNFLSQAPNAPQRAPQQQQQQQGRGNVTPAAPITEDFLRAALSAASQAPKDVSLTTVLRGDVIVPIVRNLLKDENVKKSLVEHLPESQTSDEDIEKLLRSPQIVQTLKILTTALRHGDAASLLPSLGLTPANPPAYGVQALIQAIQAQAKPTTTTTTTATTPSQSIPSQSMDVDNQDDDSDLYGAGPRRKDKDDDLDLYGK